MSTSETSASTLTEVSFLNLFGILVTVVLCVMLLVLGGHNVKYIKAFACKIKIIMNRAQDKGIQLRDFNYKGRPDAHRSRAYR